MKEKNLKLYKEGIPESDIQKIIKTIEVIGKNPIALGHGMAAKVYTFKDQPFCIKEITNENPKYSFNDTEREMEIQMDVVRMGIRSPYPILILEKEQGRKFVAMETIKGGSLRDVEEKRIFWIFICNFLYTKWLIFESINLCGHAVTKRNRIFSYYFYGFYNFLDIAFGYSLFIEF